MKTLPGMGEVEMGIEAWIGGSLVGIMSKSPYGKYCKCREEDLHLTQSTSEQTANHKTIFLTITFLL